MAVLDPRQCNQKPIDPGADDHAVVDPRQSLPFAFVLRRDPLTLTQSGTLGCGQGQSRDVVQHGLDRQQVPGSGQTMPKGQGRIQRNRLRFGEAANREPAQFDDVPDRSQGRGEVAGKGADVGALADRGLEIGMIRVRHPGQVEFGDFDLAGRQIGRMADSAVTAPSRSSVSRATPQRMRKR